jgi:hypothetical protein
MWDFYGLPRDFPEFSNQGSAYEKVRAAEQAFIQDINHVKFFPYIQLHEFEGLLFSAPKTISDALDARQEQAVFKIRSEFVSPEEINQGRDTHPSMRLEKLFPHYNKPVFGSIIAGRIGIDEIRANCPHFNDWIIKLLQTCETD